MLSRRAGTYLLAAGGALTGLSCGGGDITSSVVPGSGSLQVTSSTTGSAPDADGYTLALDGTNRGTLGSDATLTLTDISPGDHAVTLNGVAANCQVQGGTSHNVKVTAGEKATAEFTVTCAMVPIPRGTNPIAFTGNAPDLLAVFLVNADGSALTNLAEGRRPVWSPDGQKILFLKKRELWVMNADGSGQQLLSERGPAEYVWSPDGKKIGFTIEGDELWVMQSDGSAQMFLATNASNPAWSPDGNKLVFSDLADLNLRIINSDGTGNTRLTEQLAFDPAWSPDGTRITFATLDERDIWLINPDGTGRVNLTPGSSEDDGPVWSPDGSKIAFNTGPQGQPLESEVAVMSRDGTGRVVLTNHPGFDFSPAWSPDGSKIAFQRFEITGDLEIYVMNADGSGQTNVSNRSDIHDTEADW